MALHSFIAWLQEASLMGTVLAGLILLARLISGDRLNARWRHLLWYLLVLRLLVPWAPESELSLFNIFGHSMASMGYTFNLRGNGASDHKEETGSSDAGTLDPSDNYSLSVGGNASRFKDSVLFWIWFTGAAGVAAQAVFMNLRLGATMRESHPVDDILILSLFEACKRGMHLSSKGPVLRESPAIQIPMATGIFRPQVLLPEGATKYLSTDELRFILLHELAHIKRKDLYFNWAMLLLQLIHWFNPVLWYAFRCMRQDQESACDTRVLSMLEPSQYSRYGAALITFLEKCSMRHSSIVAGLVSGKVWIRMRVSAIASYRKENATGTFAGMLLIVGLGFLVLTNPKTTTATAEKVRLKNIAHEDLSHFFEPFDGSFVLFDLSINRYLVYNEPNSRERISPDSTYKLISSLAGLETGALASENTKLKWNGTVYPFKPWNKDQTLLTAMSDSVSWFFQQVDSATGKDRIEEYLKLTGYGNHDVSGGLNGFWLESSLKISPMEQVAVLKNFHDYRMPFSRENIDRVKKAIKIREMDGVVLSGKTGTGIIDGKSINGWFVGYLENRGNVYIFATNIRGKDDANGANAKGIALSILKNKKLI